MRRHLGKLEIKSVREGEGRMPMQFAVPGVTGEDLSALKTWYWSDDLSVDPQAAIFHIEVRSYLLNVDGLNVLVDTCCGNDKERSVPWAHRLQSQWLQNLAGAGCHPADIHLVLCTHLHADHVGWNTRLEDGRWVPTFPNARYVFSRKDFEFFGRQTHEAHNREAYADSVLPVVEAGLADIVDSNDCVHREIEDGIWLEDAAGQADLVFDMVGGEVLARSTALLKPGGALVSVVSLELPGDRDDIRKVFFIQEASRAQLTELARLVDEGHLCPQVGGVYPLAQAAEAYRAKAAGGIPGRIVLQP